MDLKALLELMTSHYVVLTGTTLALFFTTCMILLIRSIGNKSDDAVSSGVVATIDVKEIEGAMKRVLASQPVSIVSGSAAPREASADGSAAASVAADSSDATAHLQTQINERDAVIAQLTKDLEAAQSGSGGAASGAGDGAKSEEVEGLKVKVDELQGRLAEYEIIEDDIADLSLFKEENIRLKDENAKLKSDLANAAQAQASAPAPVSGTDSGTVSGASPAAKEPEPVLKFEKVDKFELDPNDDVMKEFAAAVSVQNTPAATPSPAAAQAGIDDVLASVAKTTKAPVDDAQAAIDAMLSGVDGVVSAPVESPLAESADHDKLLSEAQSIGQTPATDSHESPETQPDALNESLDTEKLIAEVESLKGAAAKVDDADDAFAHFNKAAQG